MATAKRDLTNPRCKDHDGRGSLGRIASRRLWTHAFPARLPLVGFEVESSWRSCKHIKGDFLNLLELQPALGVIVLLGKGPDVEGTRQFARQLVQRRASRMEVWDENDVLALSGNDPAAVREPARRCRRRGGSLGRPLTAAPR